jgi:cysteinyl-tRNA synthetase
MPLELYNTLTRKTEEFKPLNPPKVGIYVCGPTVYGHAHLGHAKSYISFDVLVRYLRYLGYSVTYIQNITDVGHLLGDTNEGEDRMLVAAAREHKHPMAVAEFYTRSYFEDMDAINCLRPDISPRASGHIPEQIELVKTLIKKGYAYEVNGSVYFNVSGFKDYGKLSGRNVEEMVAGARVEASKEKRHHADFALWKKAEPNHIMQWHSPWGMGFPGWHLECSVMSMKYLGKTIDIHGGGLENQFPHHECEIAQSEAANEVQFVRYWLHNNMVTVDGQKMGKSLNNFITLKEVFNGKHEKLTRPYGPLAVRQLVLNSHYRSPIDFSDAALFAAQSGIDKITGTVITVRGKESGAPKGPLDINVKNEIDRLKTRFETAMNDDLNTAVALSVIFDLVRLANKLFEDKNTTNESFANVDQAFRRLGGDILGIVRDSYGTANITVSEHNRFIKVIDNLIKERNKARQQKKFEVADGIRDALAISDIVIIDEKDGTTRWEEK